MSDNTPFGFAKLVPGFDFLQNIAKGTAQGLPQLPNLANWVAPTLNVEELEKRISELKAVHFWLDQNGKALAATIQALEVQKMTLATLKGMNFNMGEVASALKLRTAETMQKAGEAAEAMANAAGNASGAMRGKAAKSKTQGTQDAKEGAGGATAPVDPMQWWSALTQQFQEIAGNAMKDVAQRSAMDAAQNTASGAGKEPAKAAKKTAGRKTAPRKTRTRA